MKLEFHVDVPLWSLREPLFPSHIPPSKTKFWILLDDDRSAKLAPRLVSGGW